MTVDEMLAELGGVARRSALLRVVSRADLDTAVASGLVRREGRGVYALAELDAGARVAAALGGVLSHTSAALAHGWAVARVPDRPHVTVSRGRRLGPAAAGAHVHFAELAGHEVEDGVTTSAVTLRDCLRTLPFDEALAVADSALRESGCHQLLQHVADTTRGPGTRQLRRVAGLASPLAANPFESALRSIGVDVPGLDLAPQVTISEDGFTCRPDLVDERLRIVAEADSFEWHGGRDALAADARRYNLLVVRGWIVLRFTYEDVMFRPDEVRRILVAAVALAEVLNERHRTPRTAA